MRQQQDKIPEYFQVTIFDAMILYFNTMRASQLGWSDADLTTREFVEEAKNRAIRISRANLESMISSCVLNAEARPSKFFWHPFDKSVAIFIKELMRHKNDKQFYYDMYYNFLTTSKGKDRLSSLESGESNG